MVQNLSPSSTPTQDEIAAQAYQIYLREGCPPGREMDHWFQAETELRNGPGAVNGNGRAPNPVIVESAVAGGSPLGSPIPAPAATSLASAPARGATPKRGGKRETVGAK